MHDKTVVPLTDNSYGYSLVLLGGELLIALHSASQGPR